MVRMILNEVNSEVVVNDLENILRNLITMDHAPCRYTAEEIKASAVEAIRQRKTGNHTSHEAMKRLIKNMP